MKNREGDWRWAWGQWIPNILLAFLAEAVHPALGWVYFFAIGIWWFIYVLKEFDGGN